MNIEDKQVYHLLIDDKNFKWNQRFINGAEIRQLGNISEDYQIFLTVKGQGEDEMINNEDNVDLGRPGIEKFYSKEKNFKIILMVNGREKQWTEKTITFEQVVVLAFGSYDNNPNKVYTVTYDRGPKENPEGSMVKGDVVVVKNKMIFNVTATDKS